MSINRLLLYKRDGEKVIAFSLPADRIDVSTLDGFGSIAGLGTVRLADGTPLNVIDSNTFRNLLTDEVLFRIPPESK